jgi:hypothetical protein
VCGGHAPPYLRRLCRRVVPLRRVFVRMCVCGLLGLPVLCLGYARLLTCAAFVVVPYAVTLCMYCTHVPVLS